MICDGLKGFNIKPVYLTGTYYLLLDVDGLRGKVEKKFYYQMGKNMDEMYFHPELDQAVSRILFSKKLGNFPLSPLIMSDSPIDSFIRISINRSDEDIKYFIETMKELKKEFNYL